MNDPRPSPQDVVAALNRVTALFQARAIAAHIGAPMPKPEDFRS